MLHYFSGSPVRSHLSKLLLNESLYAALSQCRGYKCLEDENSSLHTFHKDTIKWLHEAIEVVQNVNGKLNGNIVFYSVANDSFMTSDTPNSSICFLNNLQNSSIFVGSFLTTLNRNKL